LHVAAGELRNNVLLASAASHHSAGSTLGARFGAHVSFSGLSQNMSPLAGFFALFMTVATNISTLTGLARAQQDGQRQGSRAVVVVNKGQTAVKISIMADMIKKK
jgi:hypothetical protein